MPDGSAILYAACRDTDILRKYQTPEEHEAALQDHQKRYSENDYLLRYYDCLRETTKKRLRRKVNQKMESNL
jgi:hypothetical protein